MKRKIIVIAIISMFLLTSISVVSAARMKTEVKKSSIMQSTVTNINNLLPPEEQVLNIEFVQGIHRGIKCHIYNEGETSVTNVTVISIDFDGFIGTDFKTPNLLVGELPGSHQHAADCELSVFGFGSFTVTITITCDECGDVSATASGFIFGRITYIK